MALEGHEVAVGRNLPFPEGAAIGTFLDDEGRQLRTLCAPREVSNLLNAATSRQNPRTVDTGQHDLQRTPRSVSAVMAATTFCWHVNAHTNNNFTFTAL